MSTLSTGLVHLSVVYIGVRGVSLLSTKLIPANSWIIVSSQLRLNLIIIEILTHLAYCNNSIHTSYVRVQSNLRHACAAWTTVIFCHDKRHVYVERISPPEPERGYKQYPENAFIRIQTSFFSFGVVVRFLKHVYTNQEKGGGGLSWRADARFPSAHARNFRRRRQVGAAKVTIPSRDTIIEQNTWVERRWPMESGSMNKRIKKAPCIPVMTESVRRWRGRKRDSTAKGYIKT